MALGLPFACGIGWQPYLPAEDGLVAAAAFGCTHWYIDLGRPTDMADQWTAVRLAELQRQVTAADIRPILHGSLKNSLACEVDEAIRRKGVAAARKEVEIANRLRAPLILHASSYFERRSAPLDRGAALKRFVRSLRELNRDVSRPATLWIENLPKLPLGHQFESVVSEVGECAYVLERCPFVSMVYDVGHGNVNTERPHELLRHLSMRIAAVCVSDNPGTHDAHGPLGVGNIDWQTVVSAIAALEVKPLVVFEMAGSTPRDGVRFLSRYSATDSTAS